LIIPLQKKAALREELAGAKGSNLARLARSGFPVPPGFVIGTPSFQDILERSRQRLRETQSEPIQARLQLVQEGIRQWQMPGRLEKDLRQSLARLKGPWAVRSSLVGEDSRTASYAGQLDSFLDIQREEQAVEAVKSCLCSAFNRRLIQYLQEQYALGIDEYARNLSMAVIVQEMVPARVSGVLFTADPVSGRRWTIIEASPGVGESVTKGIGEPDRYIRDEKNSLVKYKPEERSAYLLPGDQIRQLEQIGSRIAAQSGIPRDIEWAWDGKTIFLLQDRPITALVEKKVYSNRMVSDMLPGLIKPLVWTINAEGKLKNTLGRVFTQLIGPSDIDFTKLAKQIHSRLYADNSLLGELFTRMGLPANFFEMMSREEKAAGRKRFVPNAKSVLFLSHLGRFTWRNFRSTKPLGRAIQNHSRELERFRRHDWSSEDEGTLLDQIDRLIDLYSDSMWINFIGPLNMMLRQKLLSRLIKKRAPDVEPTDLLRGLMGLKSLETDREIQDLAKCARGLDQAAIGHLTDISDEAIRRELEKTETGRALLQAMDSFLEKYGFLSSLGTDISRPPWMENPVVIWHALAQRIRQPSEKPPVDLDKIREQAQLRVRARLKRGQRMIYDRSLSSLIKYVRLREQSSFLVSEDSFHLRQAFLALARRLVNRRALDQKEDIFYLDLEEIRGLIFRTLEAEDARARIAARRAAMDEDARIELPDVIYGDLPASFVPSDVPDQEYLSGIVGSTGFVRGRARIVLDPAEAPADFTQKDILVVPFSDTSWTPLFSGVGGLIAETGGLLSHTAIIAREYGLPALVNVKKATRLIRDGQLVTLDARRGRVYLNRPEGE
jgi:pyruvate,water dikinase